MTQHDGAHLIIALSKAQAEVAAVMEFVNARKAAAECDHARSALHRIERALGEVAAELGGDAGLMRGPD